MDRRTFFSQTLGGLATLLVPQPAIPGKTKFAIDQYCVERTIENFDPRHPLIPWCLLGKDRVIHGGLHVWWNPWLERFGLWAEDTGQLFVIAEAKA